MRRVDGTIVAPSPTATQGIALLSRSPGVTKMRQALRHVGFKSRDLVSVVPTAYLEALEAALDLALEPECGDCMPGKHRPDCPFEVSIATIVAERAR